MILDENGGMATLFNYTHQSDSIERSYLSQPTLTPKISPPFIGFIHPILSVISPNYPFNYRDCPHEIDATSKW
jgi:hypothetical protein